MSNLGNWGLTTAALAYARERAARTGETCILYHMPDYSKVWVRTEAEGREGIPEEARMGLRVDKEGTLSCS